MTMSLRQIELTANDHCWKEDAERKVKCTMNRLKQIEALPADDKLFGYTPKDVKMQYIKDDLRRANERLVKVNADLRFGHYACCHYQCIRDFKRLNPDRGYLRLLRVIHRLNALNHRAPFKEECQNYIKVIYGCTYNEDEVFSGLHKMGFCDFSKGWHLTELGKELLKAKDCYDEALPIEI